MRWRKLQKIAFIAFIAALVISFVLYWAFADVLSISALHEDIRNFGILAPIIFIVVYVIGAIFIPSTPFKLIAGILFGFAAGVLYIIIGGLISSLIVFKISRFLGKDWVETVIKKKHLKYIEKYDERLAKNGILDLIILRIVPVMPFNVLNAIMGITKIKIENFIIGGTIGLLPSIIGTVYLGTVIPKVF